MNKTARNIYAQIDKEVTEIVADSQSSNWDKVPCAGCKKPVSLFDAKNLGGDPFCKRCANG